MKVKKQKWFDGAHQPLDFLRRMVLVPWLLLLTHCMAVNVPEDYVSDLYYPVSPGIASLTPSTDMSWTTLSVPVLVKFDKPMDASTVTVNTTNTTCSGSIQITTAADNFTTTCLQFSSLTATTRNSVFSAALAADLDPNSDYIIKIAGTITDFQGKTLSADTTYPFKSGVPSGTEPYVVSVTPTGNWNFTITFSRQMKFSSISDLGAGNCTSTIVLESDTPLNYCNNNQNTNITPTTDSATYTLPAKLPASGTYTLRVRKDILDKFSIPLSADYTITLTH